VTDVFLRKKQIWITAACWSEIFGNKSKFKYTYSSICLFNILWLIFFCICIEDNATPYILLATSVKSGDVVIWKLDIPITSGKESLHFIFHYIKSFE
jgi:hypothetical protein